MSFNPFAWLKKNSVVEMMLVRALAKAALHDYRGAMLDIFDALEMVAGEDSQAAIGLQVLEEKAYAAGMLPMFTPLRVLNKDADTPKT